MTPDPPDAPLAVAERVLEIVRDRAGTSAEAEVTVNRGTSALTRFATSFIHQNVAEEISHVLLRVALDGRVAASSLDGPADADTIARLVDNVLKAARVAPVDEGWPGPTAPTPVPAIDHWDEGTAVCGPADRAVRVRAFVDAAGGLETAGFCATEAIESAFANSAGHHASGRMTQAAIDGIARTPSADGSARQMSVRLGDIDGARTGADAAAAAHAASDPVDLAPGRYEVVMAPPVVADILSFLAIHGFNAKATQEGRSFVRLGEPQFDRSLTIREDVGDPGMTGLAFDVEGTPRRAVDLVDGGVSSSLLHTRRTAAAAGGGVASTGNAVEGAATLGALATSLVVSPGDADERVLLAGIERGVYVADVWYTRILDPKTQVVTGLTRNGVWLIEGGRLGPAVRNLRFTQSYAEALAPGAVLGVGRDRQLLPGPFVGAFLVPSLHLAGWNFTGGAKG